MVNNVVSGPEVKPMDGSIYKSALGQQQAAVAKQSDIINMSKSGGAIPVPANQPAYPEQAAGNQSSQAISNRLFAIGAGTAENSKYDGQVGQKAGKRSKRSGKRSSKQSKRSKRSKRSSKRSKRRRSRKYYKR
jgi:hypothetical protein